MKNKNKTEDVEFVDLMAVISIYLGIPIFVGLMTSLAWGILTFVLLSTGIAFMLFYREEQKNE